ncbi:MAG: hypothetical protein COA44_13520 [Arcobacter sp.]|nr:MAG: hypothetical protein COA44_13520 [Arcobacter sp.]
MSHYILIFSLLFFASCSSLAPAKPLKKTYWSLIELNAHESSNVDHQPPIHLVFHINDNTLHGSDGCNTIRAHYVKSDESFSFTQIVSSRISCAKGSEQAQELLKALKDTNRLVIEGDEMFLYHKEQKIAGFEAKEDY